MEHVLQRPPLLVRWLKGELPLWKAVFVLQLFGSYTLLFMLEQSKWLLPVHISVTLKIITLPLFALFSSICVFQSAPDFKTTIRGTLAKCWAITYVLWALWVTHGLYLFLTS